MILILGIHVAAPKPAPISYVAVQEWSRSGPGVVQERARHRGSYLCLPDLVGLELWGAVVVDNPDPPHQLGEKNRFRVMQEYG